MSNANVFYSVDNNYNSMSDEQLISLVKADDKYALDFIIEKYKDLVNMKVGKYFIIGAEKEDIIQEKNTMVEDEETQLDCWYCLQ